MILFYLGRNFLRHSIKWTQSADVHAHRYHFLADLSQDARETKAYPESSKQTLKS